VTAPAVCAKFAMAEVSKTVSYNIIILS